MLPVTLVALVALVAPVAPTSCPAGCSCGGLGLSELTCAGGRIYRVRDDGYAEADCQGLPLNCSLIPPLPTPAPLHRLELTNCSLPPGAAACLVRALRSPPPEMLMTMSLVEGVGEGAFEGLEGVQELIMMNAESQTSVPPLSPLAPLRLRVVGGTNVTLPSNPLPSSLQSLEVSDSGVRSLTPAAFRGLNDLEILRVWGNELEEVSEEVFESLPSLRTLSLSRNPLRRLRVARAGRLRSLTARRIPLGVIHEGDLTGLMELTELIVESTSPLTLSPRSLSSLPSLSSLSVTHSGVTSLPPSLLEGSHALVNVTFKGNKLETISEDVFKNQTRLERMDLSHNSIGEIYREMFRDLSSLKELNIDYNRITALTDRMFSSLPVLSSLSVSHNLLSSISPTAFPPSPLHTLILSHNRLSYSPPHYPEGGGEGSEYFDLDVQSPLNSLLELETLDLSHNNISYVFSDWRYVIIQRLRLLDLSHNSFTTLDNLQFVQSQLTVDFTYNNISTVTPYLPPYPPSTPPATPGVTLLLDHNPYACDCYLYALVESLPSLPHYHLSAARCSLPPHLHDTPLTALDVDVLTCPLPRSSCLIRPHRLRVECTATDATSLPDPREQGLPDLAVTFTENVDLTVLPEYVTEVNMSQLGLLNIEYIPSSVKTIDLSHNKLRTLPLDLLEGNHTFYLRGNPIACDCWHSDDVRYMQKYRENIMDYKYVECEGGEGAGVGAVDAGALCGVQRVAAVGAVLAVLGVMLAVVVALSWRYSVEIRLYLGSLPGLEFLLDEDDDVEGKGEKQFDVFVSFSHCDFPWVRDTLLPVLDREYSVCVHYREWEVGRPIPLQIQRSVERSRRTLVVLSNSFVRSTWAVEEFRAACAVSARDRTTRAVVVLLEKLDLAALQEDLRDYLSFTTYLEAHDPKFWEKLKRALPRRPKRPPPAPETTPDEGTRRKIPSLFAAIKNKFKQPSVIDLPDPVKVRSDPVKVISDPKSLDVILDKNGQLVNMAYVKDV